MSEQKNELDFTINMSSANDNSTVNNSINFQQAPASSSNTAENSAQQQQPQSVSFSNFLQQAHNPVIVLFTLLFKCLAIASFILLRLFGMSDALVFIIVVILSAFDFWFVKNVSGRILVGLRWWNEVQEDGSEKWIFESSDEKKETSIDTTIFWGSTYITPIFWAVFVVLELISFSLMWLLLCVIALILTGSNAYLYMKCSGDQKAKLSNFVAEKSKAGLAKVFSSIANQAMNNK